MVLREATSFSRLDARPGNTADDPVPHVQFLRPRRRARRRPLRALAVYRRDGGAAVSVHGGDDAGVSDGEPAAGGETGRGARWLAALRRGGYVLGIAYLFRFSNCIASLPHPDWHELTKVDILNCMGVAMICVSLAARVRHARTHPVRLAGGIRRCRRGLRSSQTCRGATRPPSCRNTYGRAGAGQGALSLVPQRGVRGVRARRRVDREVHRAWIASSG